MVKFGEDIAEERLEKWKDYYVDYSRLKKLINKEVFAGIETEKTDEQIQEIFKIFDDGLKTELDKVDDYYETKCKELHSSIENIGETETTINSYQSSYQELDEVRHFCLINIIATIKIVKKRNKKLSENLINKDSIEENFLEHVTVLECRNFYKCESLLDIYEIIKAKAIDVDVERLGEAFSKCKGLLVKIQDSQPEFELNQLIQGSTSQKWSNDDIHDYIQNKLGVTHQLENIIEIEQLETRPNEVLTRLGEPTNIPEVSRKVTYIRAFIVISSLYAFLFGLDMMGSSFKALSGKNIGELFQQINNPIAGLIVGILVTVMLQSSSTTTSIIVSMVGADLVTTQQAIPLIMGANIGTSVTNTLVSHGHIHNLNEFEKAFSGATIHDIFNLMCVGVMLPFEIITGQFDSPFLYSLSDFITGSVINLKGLKFKSPLKFIVAPLVKLFISIDKKVIAANAKGCVECDVYSNITTGHTNELVLSSGCWDLDHEDCYTIEDWNEKYEEGDVIKSGLFSHLGDTVGGIVSLFFSLAVLCVALYKIVSTLHKIVLQGRGRGRILDILVKVLTKNGIVSILFGMLLTISVQSSSITTSTLTPLVGLSIISLEQMLPLTLGANLGTTCTAFIASLVTESRNAVQIAVCHFFFNFTGVVLFYPVPRIRQLPITGAKRLGRLVKTYNLFSIFYTMYVFVIVPLILLGISFLFNGEVISSLFGCVCIGLLGYGSTKGFLQIEHNHLRKEWIASN
jgi:sodium-dependent phosphate cotransporter